MTVYPAISTCYIKFSSTSAVISGQAARPAKISIEAGGLSGLSVRLQAGAFYRLFGIPASELTNRVIQLDDILGSAAHEILERVAEEENLSEWVKVFERYFSRIVRQQSGRSFPIEEQAISILRKSPATLVSQIAEKSGYSVRQFQRRLHDYIGLSPRLYKRLCRFERALDRIQGLANPAQIDWAAFALSCGYSDQAHFIREFRHFMGSTPTIFQAS